MEVVVSTSPEIDPSCPGCTYLLERLAEIEAVVAKQGAEIERLKARKPKSSRTSSKPPSSDGPWSKRRGGSRKGSGRKPGGQPGHEGKQRELGDPGDVDEAKAVKPDTCRSCEGPLSGDDPNPRRHQIIDIPPIKPRTVEYLLHRLQCPKCGESTRASLPDGVHQSNFGPNLVALICQLTGVYRMSRRNVQRLLSDQYGIEISLGAISNIERRMTEGLEKPHEEAMASVAASAVKHLDETTWREAAALCWVWVGVGDEATVFVIRDTRGSDVARELIGDEPSGVAVSDRYSGYSYIGLDQRQVCLAHLKRDFRRMAEGERALRWIGERLLGLLDEAFRLWRMYKAGDINRARLVKLCKPIRARMIGLLEEGGSSVGYETPAKCRGILQTEPAMWTFLHEDGVEPTNNAAERAIRPLVIHRKTSLGSHSKRGSEFVARMNTAVATLRRAGRDVHDFILEVAHAVLGAGPVPELLPPSVGCSK